MRFPKSFVTSGALADMRELTGGDLRVMWLIIALAPADGRITLTQTELQDGVGLSRAAIQDSVVRLNELGLITHESVRGRPTTYTVTPKLSSTAVIQMSDSPGNSETAQPGEMSSTAVISTPDMSSRAVNPLERPARGQHPYEENARRSLTRIKRERHLPLSVDELMRYAYQLGEGDPWEGYKHVSQRTEAKLDGSRNLAAVIRARLEAA